MIHDPVANRFFRIGWLDFELLSRWSAASPEELAERVRDETLLDAGEDDVEQLVVFLAHHHLLRAEAAPAVDRLRAEARRARRSPLEWLLHHYLFFRVPLLKPQHRLGPLAARLAWIYTPATAIAVVALTLLGIFLAGRQWETFASTFVDHLTLEGLAGYAVALAFAKSFHELGHAVTATRHGVRVAHMGVAFVVMFPMLYTDTSETWKLRDPKRRLAIASAGIVTELAIAGLATLAWSLVADGPVRSALFFLATASWIATLAINASPFMRFDGYFIAMDLFDLPNLHERAGAMARAWMRRTLLGWTVPDPEKLPGRGNALLVAFALATWLYRLTVFLAIALVVYHYFFKLLGIALFAVELVWFIGRPIVNELKVWFAGRRAIRTDRRHLGFALAIGGLALVMVPWEGAVSGSGWVHAQRQQALYTPLAGRLLTLPKEGDATEGAALFVLESPDLALESQRAQTQADARAQELLGLAGLPNGEQRRLQVQRQQDQFDAEARMYRGESARLSIAAPFAGVVADVDPQLAPGVWVQPRQPLAMLVDPSRWVAEVYVAEADVNRLRVGQPARVTTGGDGWRLLRGRVIEIDANRTAALPDRLLDAQAGGPIPTLAPSAERRADALPVPRDALYRVRIALDEAPRGMRAAVGRVTIEGERRAWLPAWIERAASVVVRESGF